jgi:hypothetical protein
MRNECDFNCTCVENVEARKKFSVALVGSPRPIAASDSAFSLVTCLSLCSESQWYTELLDRD